ncbi:flavin-containing monooxygenase [Marmoricola sp. RAF53]|uniref:flavin-containing monooxygenase n=1 Tax=Marmoricola sp. RAF53 TaxID=3233059 RepID=UPI003F9D394A
MTENDAPQHEHVDVLIVGAGLSGIGAAHHLATAFPGKTYLIAESRDAIGGTWDLFRYPGIRSDSDMHTLGYRFRPWTAAKSIADGPAIREYIRSTAREHGIEDRVRYGLRITEASWSDAEARWTVTATTATGGTTVLTCGLLWSCAGYYDYAQGHTPELPGRDDFAGRVVHPQFWPEDLDWTGKRVVVIGSGATAITLVPALAEKAAEVTMLQRSPSYVMNLPAVDRFAVAAHRVLGDRTGYALTRWKNVLKQWAVYRFSQAWPGAMRRLIRALQVRQLPDGYDVDTHFNPSYGPWDQRLCAVPDNDLFRALSGDRARIVTDRIDRLDATGITLESGRHLDADVVVTATGLRLLTFGGLRLWVDGEDVDIPKRVAYKGMMLSDVPNFVFTVGYTNSSWTLKADLVAEYVVRLLRRMDRTGSAIATPVNDDPALETRPMLDFEAGYVLRSLDQIPLAGTRRPWRLRMSYPADLVALRHGRLDDGVLRLRPRVPADTRPHRPRHAAAR